MATITINIPDKDIKTALAQAAEGCGFKLKDDFKVEDVLEEMKVDITGYIATELSEFFVGGIECSSYMSVLTEDDE